MWQDLISGLPWMEAFTPDYGTFQPDFTIEHTAHDLLRQLQQRFQGRRVHLVGHSLGGAVTLKMLELAPERFLSVVVSGSTVLPMGSMALLFPVMEWSLPLNQTPMMLALAARAMQVPPHHRAAFFKDQKSMTKKAFRQIMKEASNFRLSEGLKTCTVPVLAVAGSKEVEVNRKSAKAIQQHLPQALGGEISGGHHVWFAQKPQLFREVLEHWFRTKEVLSNPEIRPLSGNPGRLSLE
ncbi:alpha/beta hydrolase [Deinococcus cellulosilyticus NBRC 106333 = KACC 11606]|uniref:Alpha/beta hydrolase n=2 Tax=Deinococcus cellulosilyticus TaxID=401558 RepID=A0A511MXS1_DEIC1|nr:alpha/beta hydrolase [Deinococcus cellulosilyticus NBRC 106333 = KACC 11606]